MSGIEDMKGPKNELKEIVKEENCDEMKEDGDDSDESSDEDDQMEESSDAKKLSDNSAPRAHLPDQPLEEGEELVMDDQAYLVYHQV